MSLRAKFGPRARVSHSSHKRFGSIKLAWSKLGLNHIEGNLAAALHCGFLPHGLQLLLFGVGSSPVQHFEEVWRLGPHACVDVGLCARGGEETKSLYLTTSRCLFSHGSTPLYCPCSIATLPINPPTPTPCRLGSTSNSVLPHYKRPHHKKFKPAPPPKRESSKRRRDERVRRSVAALAPASLPPSNS